MKRMIGSVIMAGIVIMTFGGWSGRQDSGEKAVWQRGWEREERIVCETDRFAGTSARADESGAALLVNGGLYLYAGETSEEPLFVCGDVNLIDYCPDGSGGVYYMTRKDGGICLKRCTAQGEMEEVCLLDDFFEEGDDPVSWHLAADPEGNLFVTSQSRWIFLDGAGRELDRFDREERPREQLACVGTKSMLVHRFEETGQSLYLVDRKSGKEREVAGLSDSVRYACFASGEGDLLIGTDSALYGCGDEGEAALLCTWTDYGIVGDDVLTVYRTEGELHCLRNEDGILADITYIDNGEKEEPDRLTLGCFGETVWLRRAVAGYNRESDCMISIVDYWQEDMAEAAEKMEEDIRGGKGPDIIAFESEFEMDETLGREGLLEDLTPWLERSEAVGKSDLVEPLYEAALQEGKLYRMPVTFGVEAILTKEKWAGGEGNWSPAACLESMEKAAEKESLEFGMDRGQWREKLERCGLSQVDRSGEEWQIYRKIEDLLPENSVYVPEEAVRQQGEMFWESVLICDVEGYLYHKSAWGEDARYTGFPGAAGNGMAFRFIDSFGICGDSGYKEEAWKFIERYFTQAGRVNTVDGRFSADRDVLEEQFQKALAEADGTDRDGETVRMPVMTYVTGDRIVDVYGARQEEIDEIKRMIEDTAL